VGVAILTDHDPSMAYGEQTVQGIAGRLFGSIRKRLPPRRGPRGAEQLRLHPSRPTHDRRRRREEQRLRSQPPSAPTGPTGRQG
jgi:hypothetical protein